MYCPLISPFRPIPTVNIRNLESFTIFYARVASLVLCNGSIDVVCCCNRHPATTTHTLNPSTYSLVIVTTSSTYGSSRRSSARWKAGCGQLRRSARALLRHFSLIDSLRSQVFLVRPPQLCMLHSPGARAFWDKQYDEQSSRGSGISRRNPHGLFCMLQTSSYSFYG